MSNTNHHDMDYPENLKQLQEKLLNAITTEDALLVAQLVVRAINHEDAQVNSYIQSFLAGNPSVEKGNPLSEKLYQFARPDIWNNVAQTANNHDYQHDNKGKISILVDDEPAIAPKPGMIQVLVQEEAQEQYYIFTVESNRGQNPADIPTLSDVILRAESKLSSTIEVLVSDEDMPAPPLKPDTMAVMVSVLECAPAPKGLRIK